jgi:hypothetical protein
MVRPIRLRDSLKIIGVACLVGTVLWVLLNNGESAPQASTSVEEFRKLVAESVKKLVRKGVMT